MTPPHPDPLVDPLPDPPADPLPDWEPEPFRPPAWARDAHVQTLVGKLLRPDPPTEFRRERWETPDGDELFLDFAVGAATGPETIDGREGPRPLVVVLHGLEGNARRRYARVLYRELDRVGIDAVGLNFRGCAEPNRTARAYHSGETGDPARVFRRLRERIPGRPLGAVGFSLGGNVLLKLLAETGDDALLAGAVAISVPYDLDAGARMLEERPMGRVYSRYFLRSLVRKVRKKRSLLEGRVDVERALGSRTIREFDEVVTAPLHGFRDATHYYADSSSGPRLGEVRVPTLLVHALDDPFLPPDRIPLETARRNPWILPVFTPRGGHVGFLEGPPWATRPWAERQAASFLASVFRAEAAPG